jgi:hypothetical protein
MWLRTLSEWYQTVSANLDALRYNEKRLALNGLGVKVQIWRLGATNEQSESYPRWQIILNSACLASLAPNVSGSTCPPVHKPNASTPLPSWTSGGIQEMAISLGNRTFDTLDAATSGPRIKGCSGKTNGTEYARP